MSLNDSTLHAPGLNGQSKDRLADNNRFPVNHSNWILAWKIWYADIEIDEWKLLVITRPLWIFITQFFLQVAIFQPLEKIGTDI